MACTVVSDLSVLGFIRRVALKRDDVRLVPYNHGTPWVIAYSG